MPKKPPQRDPISAYQRKSIAARSVGENAGCTGCPEKRSETLNRKTRPIKCTECQRRKEGKTTMDQHHIAGAANSPITTSIPANDHQAVLTVAQNDWPEQTLANPDGCPLLRGAACIRGFVDTVVYYMQEFLLWIAEMLERLSDLAREAWGRRWWLKTNLNQFAPKGKIQ